MVERKITEIANEPKSVSIEGFRAEAHSIADRIKAARFQKEEAASSSPFDSIHHRKLLFRGER